MLRDGSYEHLGLSTSHLCLGILGVIFNSSEILYLTFGRKTRSAFEDILLSLASADFLTGNLFIIGSTTEYFDTAQQKIFINKSLLLSAVCLLLSTISHICIIATERLLSVYFPLRHRINFSKRKLNIVLVLAWMFSVCITPIYAFFPFFTMFAIVIECTIANCLLVLFYYMIVQKLRNLSQQKKRNNPMSRSNHRVGNHYDAAITSILVAFTFSLCSLPWCIRFFMNGKSAWLDQVHSTQHKVATALISLNPILDPMVYFLITFIRKWIRKRINMNTRDGRNN